jgi:hypothetical protein
VAAYSAQQFPEAQPVVMREDLLKKKFLAVLSSSHYNKASVLSFGTVKGIFHTNSKALTIINWCTTLAAALWKQLHLDVEAASKKHAFS